MTYVPGGGGGGSIATSSDVALNNASDNHLLSFNAAVSKWTNVPLHAAQERIWDGTAYPPRKAGYVRSNFVGPIGQDPAIVSDAADNDTWDYYS